jgi:glycosyltransferase involved in cell wall biosynthesis
MTTDPENENGAGALRVVLAHEWLTGMRGGERVLETLCDRFPSATVCALFADPDTLSPSIRNHRVVTSRLQGIPGITRHYSRFLPLFPAATRGMAARPADLMISLSHCVIKGLRKEAGTRHLCYCFTPMRHLWVCPELYIGRSRLRKVASALVFPSLRRWDLESVANVDMFVAVSRHVRERIREFYSRDSDVVYPPVDTEKWTPPGNPGVQGGFDLIVSALVPYKRIDMAIAAYRRLGFPLRIAGTGSESRRLRAVSARNIEFLGWQSDKSLLELYRTCRLLVFPGEEDFGIVPLEAQACGKPVVAFGVGGVTETVVPGVTGEFFTDAHEDALADAVQRSASANWDTDAIRANAERFSVGRFVEGMDTAIAKCLRPERDVQVRE